MGKGRFAVLSVRFKNEVQHTSPLRFLIVETPKLIATSAYFQALQANEMALKPSCEEAGVGAWLPLAAMEG